MKQTPVLESFSYEDVVAVLRLSVKSSSQSKVAASLGVSPQLVSMMLSGEREVSDDVAFRLGFTKLPDRYIRVPKKAGK